MSYTKKILYGIWVNKDKDINPMFDGFRPWALSPVADLIWGLDMERRARNYFTLVCASAAFIAFLPLILGMTALVFSVCVAVTIVTLLTVGIYELIQTCRSPKANETDTAPQQDTVVPGSYVANMSTIMPAQSQNPPPPYVQPPHILQTNNSVVAVEPACMMTNTGQNIPAWRGINNGTFYTVPVEQTEPWLQTTQRMGYTNNPN